MATQNVYSSSQPPRRRRKRVKMLARITSYDINLQYDMNRKQRSRQSRGSTQGMYSAPIHEESYDVMEGEILMAIDQSRAYRDGQLHCFSFANTLGDGLPASLQLALQDNNVTKSDAARKLAKFMILARLTYVGIAVTGFDSKKNSYQDMSQGFVGTVAGLNTIINTGKREIRPGDWIMAGLPDSFKFDADPFSRYKKAEGIPLDKLLFSTEVYEPVKAAARMREMYNALRALRRTGVIAALTDSVCPSALKPIKDRLGDSLDAIIAADGGLESLMSIDHQAKRMIIGQALSHARSGEPLDIVLGQRAGI